MDEIVGNLHIHTPYSDGGLYHADLARMALQVGLDFIVVTDHNVWPQGLEGYRSGPDGRRVLLLVGEEVHDRQRKVPKNHLLALGAERELAPLGHDPQLLVNEVKAAGGVAFLAHPFERPAPAIGEGSLSWVNWEIAGQDGLELWNYMSEFKSLLRSWPETIFYAFFPSLGIRAPFPEAISKWDQLLAQGKRVSVVGGTDAHGLVFGSGPWKVVVFPYAYLFRTLNMHLLVAQPLSGEVAQDRKAVLAALARGTSWVAYDLPAPTHGFRFWAETREGQLVPGDEFSLEGGQATLKAWLPRKARVELIRAGQGPFLVRDAQAIEQAIREPGAYRLQAWIHFRGRRRGWIFSNPIYLRP